MSCSNSSAPGSGFIRSDTGIDIAPRRRATVSASAARPWRANEPAINSSPLTTISISVEMLRFSSPGRLLWITSVARASAASGVNPGMTSAFPRGRPLSRALENRHDINWPPDIAASMDGCAPKPVTRLQPGRAALADALKFGHPDVRNVLERSAARETATRVAAGGVARKLLGQFGVEILSFTQSIGRTDIGFEGVDVDTVTVEEIEASPARCPDPAASRRIVADIDEVGERGDTLWR